MDEDPTSMSDATGEALAEAIKTSLLGEGLGAHAQYPEEVLPESVATPELDTALGARSNYHGCCAVRSLQRAASA